VCSERLMKYAQPTGVPSCASASVLAMLGLALGILGCGQAALQPLAASDMPGIDAALGVDSDAAAADSGKAGEAGTSDPSRSKQTGHSGCVPIHCAEPGAPACPAPSKCNPLVWLERGCVQCATNDDCGCGSCVRGRCYNRPGYCEPGCA
jgi:hypothetical protein